MGDAAVAIVLIVAGLLAVAAAGIVAGWRLFFADQYPQCTCWLCGHKGRADA